MRTLVPLQPIPSLQGNASYAGQAAGAGAGKTLITGEVVKDLGNLNFLINVGGKQVEMQAQSQLNVGQQLRLAVTQSNPLELKILSDIGESKSSPLQAPQVPAQLAATQLLPHSSVFAAKPINLSNLFTLFTGLNTAQTPLSGETLTNIANFYSLQHNFLQSKDGGGTILQQLLTHLGLNHESAARNNHNAATAELKNSLFEILATLSDNKQISGEARKLITTIEFFQLANIAQSNPNEQIFPLPFTFLEQGFIQIFFDDKSQDDTRNDEDNRIRFSLFLKMSKLGNLQVDFTGTKEGIYLHLHTDSESISQFLEGYIYQLIEDLPLQLPLLGIRFSEDAKEPAGVLLKLSTPMSNIGLVNTKA